MAIEGSDRQAAWATAQCQRYAELDGAIALIEQARNDSIARANAAADAEMNPLIAEREAIAATLEPWWHSHGAALAGEKRKSIELGGCIVGQREGRATLVIAGNEADVVEVLSAFKWAKPFLRIRTVLDRIAVLKHIDGRYASTFAELGVSRRDGETEFYIRRAEQGRTRAKV